MSLTDEQEERLGIILAALDTCKDLNSWERGFLNDQIKRFQEHGAKMFLSPKQWAVLNRMYSEKCEAEAD